ncbi:MAG TPA: AAA family ATPase [Phycisphaerales bacterium]|nr:AAA family ATPase [Phycisphaerales bacterium]
MELDITLSNYRCFSADKPAVLKLRHGKQAFVGLNNTGKSALLRAIYDLRPLWNKLSSLGGMVELLRGYYIPIRLPNGQDSSIQSLRTDNSRAPLTIEIGTPSSESYLGRIVVHQNERYELVVPGLPTNADSYGPAGTSAINAFTQRAASMNTTADVKGLLNAASVLLNSFFLPSIRFTSVGGAAGHTWYDIQLGSNFVSHLREMQASVDHSRANRFHMAERELADILGLKDLRILPVPDNGLNEIMVSVDGNRHRLDELGSGVAEFILATMSLVMRDPTYVLVDEPESHLHPALQVRYLDLLASRARHGILFSTHSLGLARHTCTNIYLVRRESNRNNSIVEDLGSQHTPAEFFGDLQYGAISSVGMDRVLLVEGTKDADVIRQWLRTLGGETRIMVVPLGGGTMIRDGVCEHLLEFHKSRVPVWAVIDSDREAPGASPSAKPAAFKRQCEGLGIPCLLTARRAIENYMTQSGLDAAFPESNFQAIGHHDNPKDSGWKSTPFWRAAREMSRSDILNTDIGEFLERCIHDKQVTEVAG